MYISPYIIFTSMCTGVCTVYLPLCRCW